jgi:hypothetical protein
MSGAPSRFSSPSLFPVALPTHRPASRGQRLDAPTFVDGKARPSLVAAMRLARLVDRPVEACFTEALLTSSASVKRRAAA